MGSWDSQSWRLPARLAAGNIPHAGARPFDSYQMRYGLSGERSPGRRHLPRSKVHTAPSLLLQSDHGVRLLPFDALIGRVDPKLTTAVPTLQVRVLEEKRYGCTDVDQSPQLVYPHRRGVQHTFRGRVLCVGDDRFEAVLESDGSAAEEYTVTIPLSDLHETQRRSVYEGVEFTLHLTVKHGPNFQELVDRRFLFEDGLDDLPTFSPQQIDEGLKAAARRREAWRLSTESYDD